MKFRSLFSARNRLFGSSAHVGNDPVSAAVLFRVWVYGCYEPVTNREWKEIGCSMATGKDIDRINRIIQDEQDSS
jgi:hypothetical protein